MPFDAEGKLKSPQRGNDNKPRKPAEWPSAVYHHIIPWNVLRAFWNLLVDNVKPVAITKKKGKRYTGHQKKQMQRYLAVVGFEANAHPIVEAIWEGRFQHVNPALTEDLDWRLCWQPYNLVVGPRDRPGHAPDPGEEIDFPPMAPPNGARATDLLRASRSMQNYLDTSGGVLALGQALELLETVSSKYPDIVPEYDVNWYALRQDLFWDLTKVQRRQFADAYRENRRLNDPQAVYQLLFGSGL